MGAAAQVQALTRRLQLRRSAAPQVAGRRLRFALPHQRGQRSTVSANLERAEADWHPGGRLSGFSVVSRDDQEFILASGQHAADAPTEALRGRPCSSCSRRKRSAHLAER